MTIRSQISRKKRKAVIFSYSGMVLLFLGIILVDKSTFGWLLILPFVGFAVSVISGLYVFWRIRCPQCKGNFGYVAMYYGTPFSLSKKINFCPFCGIGIDTEFKEQNKV
jgi:hypothetical protein